ncbi:hypothetical protein [Maricaulis sp. CAU 1757]
MTRREMRTLTADLPADLVRRTARFVQREGGLGNVMEQALEMWLDREESREAQTRIRIEKIAAARHHSQTS